MIFHIPNEGKNNANLIKIGLYPGAADLQIIDPNGTAYFVELKALGKTQRPNQKDFEAHCKQTGVPYYLADNIENAIAIGESIVEKWKMSECEALTNTLAIPSLVATSCSISISPFAIFTSKSILSATESVSNDALIAASSLSTFERS